MKSSRGIVVACVALGGLVASIASGDPSGAGRRAEAVAAIAELSSSAPSVGVAPSVSASIARAKAALEAADKARSSQSELHAQIAEGAAADWAGTAKSLDVGDRALSAATIDEAGAAVASASASTIATRLDESIARRTKLRAALDDLEAEAAARPLSSASTPVKAKAPKTKGKAR